MSESKHSPEPHGEKPYETEEILAWRTIRWGLLVLVVMVVVALIAGRYMLDAFTASARRQGEAQAQVSPPAVPRPALQANPQMDIVELRRVEEGRLSSYGWVDKERGIVYVPIERAMELLTEKGLPARKTQEVKESR
ncbi:MAG: hypothetical protein K6T17_06190 [Fimbriimonadales bacterium]|nr:hypothetical protein [Fimbriimonadales bacterium]